MKNFSGHKPPDYYLFLLPLPHIVLFVVCNDLLAFILKGVTDFLKSVNSSAAAPYTGENNMVSIT